MILTGIARLGRDATVRDAGDTKVANLSLAYNYGKKDANGKRATVWIDASLWGERAEKLAPYLLKGQQISVVLDDVFPASYDKQDGSKAMVLKARVAQVEFAGARPEGAAPKQDAPSKPAADPRGASKFDDFEDDIPF